MTYQEQLKSPKWQKKRLFILERDNWACQICGDTENMLSVHHMDYIKGYKPWDYENEYLITLCSSCHSSETECNKEALERLRKAIKKQFFSFGIELLAEGFEKIIWCGKNPTTADIINYVLQNEECMKFAEKKYFESMKKPIKIINSKDLVGSEKNNLSSLQNSFFEDLTKKDMERCQNE